MIERCMIIAVINLILYFRTLYFGYVGDDIERSKRDFKFRNNWHGRWSQYRCEKHVHPMVAHAISLINHTICCILVYITLYTFTGLNTISFLTAILFSINPVGIQGSVWISGRNYATATILTLLMLLFPLATPFLYYATSFFAVNAWFAPLIFIGTKWWYMTLSIPIIWIIFKKNRRILHTKLWETNIKTTNKEMRSIHPKKIIPFIKCYGYYFRLAIFPYVMSIDHPFLYGFGTNKTDNQKGYWINKDFFIGLACLSILPLTYYLGYNVIGWGLLWFTVNIAMWCNYTTIQQQISQRYVYLASVGMMFAIANVIVNYPTAITVFITAYLVRLWYSIYHYIDDWWAIEGCIHENPAFHYPWLMRGVKKFSSKDFSGAFWDFRVAYTCKPYDFKTIYNMAAGLFMVGNIKESKEMLEKARQNTYDELDENAIAPMTSLKEQIKIAENSINKSDTSFRVDLSKVSVVK